jgi:hypothetical protein
VLAPDAFTDAQAPSIASAVMASAIFNEFIPSPLLQCGRLIISRGGGVKT